MSVSSQVGHTVRLWNLGYIILCKFSELTWCTNPFSCSKYLGVCCEVERRDVTWRVQSSRGMYMITLLDDVNSRVYSNDGCRTVSGSASFLQRALRSYLVSPPYQHWKEAKALFQGYVCFVLKVYMYKGNSTVICYMYPWKIVCSLDTYRGVRNKQEIW